MSFLNEAAPRSVEEHVNAVTTRIERLELRDSAAPGGGGATVFVQPDEPPNAPTGTLWFDTDQSCNE